MSKRQPVYDLNSYLLNATEVGGLLGWPNLNNISPIIPTQQQPETNERNEIAPYMVYAFRTAGAVDEWWIRTDDVSYVIWGGTFDEVSEVANEIFNALSRLDESAAELNSYLYSRGAEPEWTFHYVRLMSSTSPEPALEEGGRLGWMITLRYEYTPN